MACPRRRIACLCGLMAAIALLVGATSAAGAAPALTQAQAKQVGTDAYVYGSSLMEFLRQQQQNTSVTVPDDRADAPINQLGNDRTLASASNEAFVGPNLDTLYTFAHVDLSNGPLVLHVPPGSDDRRTPSRCRRRPGEGPQRPDRIRADLSPQAPRLVRRAV
jgi:hypothetical protein